MAKKPEGAEREALLLKRETLVKELEAFKAKGPSGRAAHQLKFFQEDLIAKAHQIVKIDRKLGREVGD